MRILKTNMYVNKNVIKKSYVCIFLIFLMLFSVLINVNKVYAMPFYNLKPQYLTLRSSFYTTYSNSSEERKSNISLAAKSLDNVLVDVGAEFSFNKTVGARTEKRGYKKSKIIFNGEFVDGVGGGVCQVSTTLYNAIILSGLLITECHAHSLPVSYVAPSFDAMVNSGSADLRFVNNTYNPIIIKASADGNILKIELWGEPLTVKYTRQSIVIEEIPAPPEEEVYDDKGEYPELFVGEKKFLRYSKAGLKSEGYIILTENGKIKGVNKIRTDKYSAQRGLVIHGRAERVLEENYIDENVDNI